MTSKADFIDQWKVKKADERRPRLDELGAIVEKTDEEWREHDALASLVADDEEAAKTAQKEKDKDEGR